MHKNVTIISDCKDIFLLICYKKPDMTIGEMLLHCSILMPTAMDHTVQFQHSEALQVRYTFD